MTGAGPLAFLSRAFGRERRSSLENPSVPLSDPEAWARLFGVWSSTAGPVVTVETAMGIPAVWCAVNVLADLIASLPLHEFRREDDGARERITRGRLPAMFSGTVNEDLLTSYKWRRGSMVSALLTGAGRTWVEKNALGQPVNFWPLETARTTVVREGGRTSYRYQVTAERSVVYAAHEVINITFVDGLDGVAHFVPVERLRDTLGLAIALERYASKFFQNGGVPPLALHTPLGSPAANARAKTDTDAAIKKANVDRSNVLIMPPATELKPIGFDPEKGQLVEAQRFVVEQVCRVFNLPPSFVHDLTHGTFANTEQADLHLVKHTATAWVRQWETELNAKLYGQRQTNRFAEFNLDGLLRGDFKTRMEGWARAIQTGQATPNEARRAENRPDMEGGNELYIQGATVPISHAGNFSGKGVSNA